MFRSFAAFFVLFPALVSAEPATPTTKDIPRYLKVADGFYRGGQPEGRGFHFLKQQGIKTVINLREENDEEATVRGLGMNYIHIPMSVSIKARIPEKDIQKYFTILNDPANFPIFIHCKRGADRTGAMVGFYRIGVQGWEGPRAYEEARNVGMRWWFSGLKQQLHQFKAPELSKTAAKAN